MAEKFAKRSGRFFYREEKRRINRKKEKKEIK
jgi:hypothetical protein